jgi:SAM-dependent methyltransferase
MFWPRWNSGEKNHSGSAMTHQIFSGVCPVCGGQSFAFSPILWLELIADWELSQEEVKYIDRQQGYCCKGCGNNLRSMVLAAAILKSYEFVGTLTDFVQSDFARSLNVLEINEAGGLSAVLANLPNHRLVRYPDYDMTKLDFPPGSYDLVLHSDTLEHVSQPITGLAECRRVLSDQGRCVFTVPIVVGRLSRARTGLKNSYHGSPEQAAGDLIVHTEFGADVWRFAAEAGFTRIIIHAFEYPAGLAMEVSCK